MSKLKSHKEIIDIIDGFEEVELSVHVVRLIPFLLTDGVGAAFVVGNSTAKAPDGNIQIQVSVEGISDCHNTGISTGTDDIMVAFDIVDKLNFMLGLTVKDAGRIQASSMQKREVIPDRSGITLCDEALQSYLADSIGDVREALGAENSSDKSFDDVIEDMSATEYLEMWSKWNLGDPSHAKDLLNVYHSALEAGGQPYKIGD